MRGVVKFGLTLVIGVALIWLAFWWYAESRLQSGFRDWADSQATQGAKISYDSVQRGNSPLNAAITIRNLVFTLPGPQGERSAVSLPAVTLRIHAIDPLVFHTDLPNRIGFAFGNFALVCNTGSISLTENLDPNKLFDRSADPFRGGDFAASDIDILASEGSLLVLHIDRIASHADLNLGAGPGASAFVTTTALDGLAVSPLLTRLASIPFGGKLTHLEFSGQISGPVPANLPDLADQLSQAHDPRQQQKLLLPALHQWAAQGGSGNLGLGATLGPSTLNARASVKFDANLQPEGGGDLTADHLDRFTAALINAYPSLQDDIAQAEAQFSPYLSNTDSGGQTLTLHMIYGAPGIFINGQKTAEMPPLDWDEAENPPIQAPGDGAGAAGSGNAMPGPAHP